MAQITLVATCMGRLSFLRQALPTWLAHTDFPILVLDYSCPDGTARWVRSLGNPRVTVFECAAQIREGRPIFSASRARNQGVARVRTPYVLLVDADVCLLPGFGEWISARLSPGTVITAELEVPKKNNELYGLMALEVSEFHAAGAFDEEFRGWGLEDCDLRARLFLNQVRRLRVPEALMLPLKHSNLLRTQHYEEKSLRASMNHNRRLLSEKLLRLTGRGYEEWMQDPAFKDMLSR